MRLRLTTPMISLLACLLLGTSVSAQSVNVVQSAMDMVRAAGDGECSLLETERQAQGFKPEVYRFDYKAVYDDAPKTFRLIRVPCWLGAYNQGDMYVLVDPYDTLTLLSFAVPQYDVTYFDTESAKVKSVRVTGYTSRLSVVLSSFDPQKLEISEHNLSRGIGDASTSAVWRFKNGGFGLRRFDLDASYDGEINPQRLVDFGGPK